MRYNDNRTQRHALNQGLKFHAPGSPEYEKIIEGIKKLDREYHNASSTSRPSKAEMLKILSSPTTKR